MNIPEKMIPVELPTTLLGDASLFVLTNCERVARPVDSVLRRKLTWSPFKQLIYGTVPVVKGKIASINDFEVVAFLVFLTDQTQ